MTPGGKPGWGVGGGRVGRRAAHNTSLCALSVGECAVGVGVWVWRTCILIKVGGQLIHYLIDV